VLASSARPLRIASSIILSSDRTIPLPSSRGPRSRPAPPANQAASWPSCVTFTAFVAGPDDLQDWHGPQTASLAQLSFRLHQEYADAHDGAKLWGYRRLDTLSVSANTRSKGKGKVPEGLEWLRSDIVKGTKILGTKRTTAQVHPRLLTMRLVELAQAKGAKVILGQVNAIEQALGSGPTAVVVLGRDGHSQTIPATDVIITAGPWSGDLAYKLLGKQLKKRVAIEGNRAHSVRTCVSSPAVTWPSRYRRLSSRPKRR
jgi:glycine/D-amino acid oxidase-like deaminating enzyme